MELHGFPGVFWLRGARVSASRHSTQRAYLMTAKTDAKPGPLAGLRVIDLTQFVLGPYATMTLGDLGADVIKVEEPSGDRQRNQGKAPKSDKMGPMFVAFNRNKRSVAFDLKTDEGKEQLRELVRTGDVFIHNMRPEAIR